MKNAKTHKTKCDILRHFQTLCKCLIWIFTPKFQLSSYAEEWAQKLAREDTFEHRTNQELGENLYCSWSSNPKAKCPGDKPVDSWYSEIKKYNFGAEPTNLSSGESSSIDWLVIFDKTNSQTCLSRPFYPSCVEELEKVGHWQGQKQEW